MNQIVNLTAASTLTMSSREIAELTGKLHLHVMRDIRAMLQGLFGCQSNFGSTYFDAQGKSRPCFNLPKRETLILVSGYSVELRARIIDRWMELEAQAVAQPVAMVDASALVSQLAQLVQALTPLAAAIASGNQQAAPKAVEKPRYSEEDFKPIYSASMIKEMTDDKAVLSMSNAEIGQDLTHYSQQHKFPIEWRKKKVGSVNKYCRAAIESRFGMTL